MNKQSRPEQQRLILPFERELIGRVGWFIVLRWFAAVGICAGTAVGRLLFQLDLPVWHLLGAGLVVSFYNGFLWLYYRRLHQRFPNAEATDSDVSVEDAERSYRYFIHLQVLLDWIALAYVVHLSGGIQSPVLLFFVFHVLISSLLLPPRDCYVQATLVIAIAATIAWLEYASVLSHNSLYLGESPLHINRGYIVTQLAFFLLALYITVFLATSVAAALRARERRLMILQSDLQVAYEQLEEATMAKSQFVLMVTHELRSPLAAMQSMLKVVLGGYAGEISDKARDMVERSERRLLTLLDLVKDLLDLAADQMDHLESKVLQLDVMPIVCQQIDAIQGSAEAKGIELDTYLPESPVLIESDERDIERVLVNLLSNAVKYTPSGGHVAVSVEVQEDQLILEVTDTGIGIPEEAQAELFTEFYRAPNAKQFVEHGTGLGLATVKRIVEQHAGEISMHSKVGEGTRFRVCLPRCRS